MANKARRPRSANPRTYTNAGNLPAVQPKDIEAAAPQARPATTRPSARPSTMAARPTKQVDLHSEYPFVGKDLRRLGLTAAAMFTVLILLNLVLNVAR